MPVFYYAEERSVAELNKHLKEFADNYLADPKRNAYKAALKAGYTDRTARHASEWISQKTGKNGKINKEFKSDLVEYIQAELDKIHSEKTADAREVMEYLTRVMRGEEKEKILQYTSDGHQDIVETDVAIKERTKAAELIGKSYGVFRENISAEIQPITIVSDLKE